MVVTRTRRRGDQGRRRVLQVATLISRLDMLSAMVRRCPSKDVGAPCGSTVSIVTKRPPVPGCARGPGQHGIKQLPLGWAASAARASRRGRLRGSGDVYPRCAASVASHAARVARGGRTSCQLGHWVGQLWWAKWPPKTSNLKPQNLQNQNNP